MSTGMTPGNDPRAPGALATRWGVGLLRLPTGTQPYTLSLKDIAADTDWARSVLQRIGVVVGRPLHVIGAGGDNLMLWPYENALIGLGVPFGVAEPAAIDAPRSDMFLRRFRMQAVLGLSGELVDAFLLLGRDLQALLGHSTVLALPDAAARLREHGLAPWTMWPLGPIWAIEAPSISGVGAVYDRSQSSDVGAVYDRSQWLVEEAGGELLLTAVASRATPFVRLRTGYRGRVDGDRVFFE